MPGDPLPPSRPGADVLERDLAPSTSTVMFFASTSAVRTNASSIFFFKSDGVTRGLTTNQIVTPLTPDNRRTT